MVKYTVNGCRCLPDPRGKFEEGVSEEMRRLLSMPLLVRLHGVLQDPIYHLGCLWIPLRAGRPRASSLGRAGKAQAHRYACFFECFCSLAYKQEMVRRSGRRNDRHTRGRLEMPGGSYQAIQEARFSPQSCVSPGLFFTACMGLCRAGRDVCIRSVQ